MNVNDKILFRTCGHGNLRVWKGTIKAIVNRGKLAPKGMRMHLPHGGEVSNRPRYVVLLSTSDTLMWANATGPNIALQGRKLPTHKPRLAVPVKKYKPSKWRVSKATTKAKPAAKAKPTEGFAGKDAGLPPLEARMTKFGIVVDTKRKGGDKPKTTWFGIVDGAVVSVRKVICPEGFSKEKPTLPEAHVPRITKPEVHIPDSSASPAAETALPQVAETALPR